MNEATMRLSRNLQAAAKVVNAAVQEAAGVESMGWSLIVFTEGRASYISNCKRPEVIEAMRELLKSWDAGLPDIPAHEIG